MGYYTLVARYNYGYELSPWQIEFGDYTLEVVQQEMQDRFESHSDSACVYNIFKTATDRQAEIKAVLDLWNEEIKRGIRNQYR